MKNQNWKNPNTPFGIIAELRQKGRFDILESMADHIASTRLLPEGITPDGLLDHYKAATAYDRFINDESKQAVATLIKVFDGDAK